MSEITPDMSAALKETDPTLAIQKMFVSLKGDLIEYFARPNFEDYLEVFGTRAAIEVSHGLHEDMSESPRLRTAKQLDQAVEMHAYRLAYDAFLADEGGSVQTREELHSEINFVALLVITDGFNSEASETTED